MATPSRMAFASRSALTEKFVQSTIENFEERRLSLNGFKIAYADALGYPRDQKGLISLQAVVQKELSRKMPPTEDEPIVRDQSVISFHDYRGDLELWSRRLAMNIANNFG